MRDALGILVVALGLGGTLLTGSKVGLVVAFAGVTILAYGLIRPGRSVGSDPEPPIF